MVKMLIQFAGYFPIRAAFVKIVSFHSVYHGCFDNDCSSEFSAANTFYFGREKNTGSQAAILPVE